VTLLSMEEARGAPVEEIGGKARGLAELVALGLPVPPAVVLTATVHDRWRETGALEDATRRSLQRAAEPLGWPLAVRSSASDEDSAERSAAGQYESVMEVGSADELTAAVEGCYRHADGQRAVAYRGGEGARLALVIQRQIRPQRAGIAFSVDPLTGSDDHVLIEAVFGHGEAAVAGLVTPDRFRVSRHAAAVKARIARKPVMLDGRGAPTPLAEERAVARTLRNDEAQRIAEMVLDAERGAGRPVDVEFCLAGPELWAVQSRPITTLSGHV
jgi:rifampicin phosphotransferase